jgi:hypothetical protein
MPFNAALLSARSFSRLHSRAVSNVLKRNFAYSLLSPAISYERLKFDLALSLTIYCFVCCKQPAKIFAKKSLLRLDSFSALC